KEALETAKKTQDCIHDLSEQPEIINFSNKLVAFKISNGVIAAHTQPIWLNIMRKKFARPIGEALTNQCKTGHCNENGLCFQRLRDPIGCKAFAGTTGH